MNLQRVSVAASGPLTFTCACCGEKANQAHATVYADLEGPAFTAYLCAYCAVVAERCGHCGSYHKSDRSCGCADNGSQ